MHLVLATYGKPLLVGSRVYWCFRWPHARVEKEPPLGPCHLESTGVQFSSCAKMVEFWTSVLGFGVGAWLVVAAEPGKVRTNWPKGTVCQGVHPRFFQPFVVYTYIIYETFNACASTATAKGDGAVVETNAATEN